MKPLITILILVSFISLPGTISGASTPEERCRAATVSALRHHVLPPQLLRLIASNGHVTRDCEELEMGFFPQNEWKALKRVFQRNERTSGIRHVIDRYVDSRAACENVPEIYNRAHHGNISWWKKVLGLLGDACIAIRLETGVFTFTEITLNEDHEITSLFFDKLIGQDICDLSNLLKNLKTLGIYDGDLTNFDFSKLPKGLRWLVHPGPDAESKLHVQSLPPRLETLILRGYGKRRNEDPLEVHFYLPLPQGLELRVPRMDELVFHPGPAEINEKITRESNREKTWEVLWDDGSQIYLIIQLD